MKYLTTLTGPSCAGKSTLEKMLAERGAQRAISTTTRAPRAGERNGVDYYFVDDPRFHHMRNHDLLVECVQFGENWYGLSVPELERLFSKGDYVVVVCEPIGAKQINEFCNRRRDIKLTQVFVDNPLDVINDRFLTRFYEDVCATAQLGSKVATRKVVDAHAKRLTVMQTIERTWRDESGSYDIYLPTFDEYNGKAVAITLSDPSQL